MMPGYMKAYTTPGQRFKAHRKELQLSQKDLAEQLDVAQSYVCNIERDKQVPNIAVVAALERLLEDWQVQKKPFLVRDWV